MSLTNAKIVWLALAATLVAGTAHAQTVGGTPSYQTSYALNRGQTASANVATRDANGNAVLLDGQIETGADNSIYANSKTLGAGDTYAGAGAVGGQTTTTAGNTLHVVVSTASGNVFDHSTQTHNGAVAAQANETAAGDTTASSLNGQVNLNGF